jgi:GDPmannose 4,6-dehydratase
MNFEPYRHDVNTNKDFVIGSEQSFLEQKAVSGEVAQKEKVVVITGMNGQLSQYLIKYLQEKEPSLKIVGTIRHKSYDNQSYIFDKSKVTVELMDLGDPISITNLILKYKPDYFINTAANAYVGESWDVPIQQMELNCLGVLHQLEAIKKHSPQTRYFNMGTSEEFAVSEKTGPQNEETRIYPKSPYGCAKAAARYLVSVYRKSFGLYAIQGWTFNFESKLRGEKYVTRKITKGIARIYHAIKELKDYDPLELGNIYSNRSWQHASDVADGVWRALNQEKYLNETFQERFYKNNKIKGVSVGLVFDDHLQKFVPREYVLSATDTYTVKEFIEAAFLEAGKKEGIFTDSNLEWVGEGLNEKLLWANSEKPLVVINKKFYRPLDVTYLHGDASSIKHDLGWDTTVSFNEIVEEMVKHDIDNYNKSV